VPGQAGVAEGSLLVVVTVAADTVETAADELPAAPVSAAGIVADADVRKHPVVALVDYTVAEDVRAAQAEHFAVARTLERPDVAQPERGFDPDYLPPE